MAILPKPEIIIAAFLIQISARITISCNEQDFNRILSSSASMCRNHGLLVLLLVSISAGVSMVTFLKYRNYWQAFITFATSFLVNFSGDSLGYLTVHCFTHTSTLWSELLGKKSLHTYIAFPIMATAFLGILIHYLKKRATLEETKIPDTELLLLGICAQFMVWHAIAISPGNSGERYNRLCVYGGVGSLLHLLAISGFLAVLTLVKTRNTLAKKARATYTFIASLALNLLTGGAGRLIVVCVTSLEYSYDKFNASYTTNLNRKYAGTTMVLNAYLAFVILLNHLVEESP